MEDRQSLIGTTLNLPESTQRIQGERLAQRYGGPRVVNVFVVDGIDITTASLHEQGNGVRSEILLDDRSCNS